MRTLIALWLIAMPAPGHYHPLDWLSVMPQYCARDGECRFHVLLHFGQREA